MSGFIFAKAFCPAGPKGPAHAENGNFLGPKRQMTEIFFAILGAVWAKSSKKQAF